MVVCAIVVMIVMVMTVSAVHMLMGDFFFRGGAETCGPVLPN